MQIVHLAKTLLAAIAVLVGIWSVDATVQAAGSADNAKRVDRAAGPQKRAVDHPRRDRRIVDHPRQRRVVTEPDRPTKSEPPRIKIACFGGRVVRSTCLCPAGTRRTSSGESARCVAIVRPQPPRGPVVALPVPSQTTIATPFDQPGRRGLPPPQSGTPTPPQAGLSPSFTVIGNAPYLPDEVLVMVASAAPQSVEDGVAARFNLQLLERTPLALTGQRLVRYRIPDGRLVPAVIAALAADPAISEPQPNFIYRAAQQPAAVASLPVDDLQYALTKIEFASAQKLASGRGATVAIIDTGVDVTHPDLNAGDIQSYDAINQGAAKPGVHGTAIAGIIGGRGLTHGIAPQAKLYSVRAFTAAGDAQPQVSTSYVLLKAIDWAIAQRSRVLNLSFAGSEDPMLRKAIAMAFGRDAIMIAAAGNNGHDAQPVYPAAYEHVIAVTAVNVSDQLYEKANVGSYVAVAAPGVEILAPSLDRSHELQTGTSFAAAHVSAIVALMLELDPQISASMVRSALAQGAVELGGGRSSPQFGAGLVNAAASLRLVTAKR